MYIFKDREAKGLGPQFFTLMWILTYSCTHQKMGQILSTHRS